MTGVGYVAILVLACFAVPPWFGECGGQVLGVDNIGGSLTLPDRVDWKKKGSLVVTHRDTNPGTK